MDEAALLQNYLIVGALLFGIGLIGLFSRRNMIVMFLAAEMNAARRLGQLRRLGALPQRLGGQVLVIFISHGRRLRGRHRAGPGAGVVSTERLARHCALASAAGRKPPDVYRFGSAQAKDVPAPRLAPPDAGRNRNPRSTARRRPHRAMFDLDTLMVLIPALPWSRDCHGDLGKHVLRPSARPPADGDRPDRTRSLAASPCCSRCTGRRPSNGSSAGPRTWRRFTRSWGKVGRLGTYGPICGVACTSDSVLATPPAAYETGHVAGQPVKLPGSWVTRLPVRHRRHPARRSAHGDHALDGDVPSLRWWRFIRSATCMATRAIGVFFSYISLFVFLDDHAWSASAISCCSTSSGKRSHVQLPAGRLLVRKTGGRGGRQKGVPGQSRWRFWFCPRPVLDLRHLRHAQFLTMCRVSWPECWAQTRLARPQLVMSGEAWPTAIGLLLLVGACGKSAQFPLHVWLPTPWKALLPSAP